MGIKGTVQREKNWRKKIREVCGLRYALRPLHGFIH